MRYLISIYGINVLGMNDLNDSYEYVYNNWVNIKNKLDGINSMENENKSNN